MLDKSLTASSKRSYQKAYQHIKEFHDSLNLELSLPISINRTIAFISYLHEKQYAPSTITTYLSAIAYYHKTLQLTDPTNSMLVRKCVKGLRKNNNRKEKPRVTLRALKALIRVSDKQLNQYEAKLFQCVATMLFFGMFRISELVGDERLGIEALNLNQLTLTRSSIKVKLTKFKHSNGENAVVEMKEQKQSKICPIKNAKNFLDIRGSRAGRLFRYENHKPVTKTSFASTLAKCSKAAGYNPPFTSHCFRIGGATEAAKRGRTEAEIKLLGRWKSNAYMKYTRKTKPLIL